MATIPCIVAGLGKVYFSAIGMLIDVDLQVMTLTVWYIMML